MAKTKIGIIGCGNISAVYLKNLTTRFGNVQVVACADIDPAKAQARAEEFKIQAISVEKLLAHPEIQLVLNLTIPAAHAPVALQVLNAGKHVYGEKPFANTRDEGKKVLQTAKSKKLRVGCAPDTFLGGGLQTVRKLLDDGWIGQPVGATAFMISRGMEMWHPDPVFFFQPGGGPMFDMGPYYLTALVHLLGPIKRVTGSARITLPQRLITSKPKYGQNITVTTPTHIAGVFDFTSGPVVNMLMTFDVYGSELPRMELYGTEGTIMVPDPNFFAGPVKLKRGWAKDWSDMPIPCPYTDNARGLGVADMAAAIQSGRPHRASGELAYHVLDVMQAFLDASEQEKHIKIASTCSRPAPLPLNLREGDID